MTTKRKARSGSSTASPIASPRNQTSAVSRQQPTLRGGGGTNANDGVAAQGAKQDALSREWHPPHPDARRTEPASTATEGSTLSLERNALPRKKFFIVGIGASAGGLDAIKSLLSRALADDASYVVIQHLAPQHSSMLSTLLDRGGRLRAITIADKMDLQPNIVYVTPPMRIFLYEIMFFT